MWRHLVPEIWGPGGGPGVNVYELPAALLILGTLPERLILPW